MTEEVRDVETKTGTVCVRCVSYINTSPVEDGLISSYSIYNLCKHSAIGQEAGVYDPVFGRWSRPKCCDINKGDCKFFELKEEKES